MYETKNSGDKMKLWILKAWKENKSLVLFIFLMVFFRSAIADWNSVPTGSMKPTIVEGDRILVNKLAYDVKVPFTNINLFEHSAPQRGDIIVFDSDVSQKKLVKRVVGVPNDVVELKNNVLSINGEPLDYEVVASTQSTLDKKEDLLGIEHSIRINRQGSSLSSFGKVKVPAGYYLVLGDNRDNSGDSRVIGFVPRHEIVGRSKRVLMSLDYENFFLPRKDRFFHTF